MLVQKKDRLYLAGVVVFGVLEALFIIMQMYWISKIANLVFLQHIAVDTLHNEFVQLILLMLLVVVTGKAGGWLADSLAFSVKNTTSALLLEKLDRMGGVYGSGIDSGKCFVLLTDGVERLETFFAQFLPQALKTALIPILFLIVVFPVDWVSGILLFVTIPIVIAFMMLIGRFSKNASEQQWSILQTISGFLHDAMIYLPWLKIWGRAEDSAVTVEHMADDFRVRTLKVMQVAFLSAFVLEFFTMIGVALVAVTLGVRLIEGMVVFQMALFVILLAPEFYLPLRTLGGKYHDSISAMSAFREITAFLNKAESVRGDAVLQFTSAPTVVMQQAGFVYEESGSGVSDLQLNLYPGESTVIFGESGCGKSTLLSLASGMKIAQNGAVLWNDVDVSTLSLDTVRSQVGFLGQDVYVFSGSVYDNIALGDLTITIDMVREACKAIGFDSIVQSFSNGYDTLLGENGRGLSGGQKRMLGIARIFVRDRKFIVCDEPFAGLDYLSEQMVYQALYRLLEGRTALLVSHREEIIHLADHVYFMEQGTLHQQ